MADKMKDSDGQANTKQKVTVVALILVVAFIGWQVMGLMGGSATADATDQTTPARMDHAGGGSNASAQMGAGSPAAPGATAPAVTSSVSQAPVPLPVSPVMPGAQAAENELAKIQQESQAKILESINALQMLKIQREMAEMSQAIAAARLATVTAEKSISDVLTKPTLPDLPASAYAESLSGGAAAAKGGSGGAAEGDQDSSDKTAGRYVLLSVSMQFNKWNAVLGYKGKLYNVSVGDTLAADGSTVVSIGKDSVVLEKEGVKTKLSMISSI